MFDTVINGIFTSASDITVGGFLIGTGSALVLGILLAFMYILIPQNSKRRSESKEGMNPSITTSKSKAEFTSVNSEMTCDQHKIIDYGTNPAAFNSAVTDRHIILLH